jgi:Planctomycete cytochrome C
MKHVILMALAGLTASLAPALADDKWDISKYDVSKLPPAAKQTGLTFAKDIKPLFDASCTRCHGEERQKGDFRADSLAAILKGGEDGKMVVPGKSARSLLLVSVAQLDPETAMPPKRRPGGPGGPGGPEHRDRPEGGPGRPGGPGAPGAPGGPGGPNHHDGPDHHDGPGGPGGPGRGGPPPKPLTVEEVALVRAWIDQGAK